MTERHRELDDDQVRVLSRFDGASAAEVAERLGCSLLELAEQLVVIRSVLGVDSTAAAIDVVRARGLI